MIFSSSLNKILPIFDYSNSEIIENITDEQNTFYLIY